MISSNGDKSELQITPVLAAIIRNARNEILVARRKNYLSQGALWEFPGGKLKLNESPEECLRREVKEELGIEIRVEKIWHGVNYSYPDKNILLIAYLAHFVSGKIILTDHSAAKWISVNDLDKIHFSAADVPIRQKLLVEFKANEPQVI